MNIRNELKQIRNEFESMTTEQLAGCYFENQRYDVEQPPREEMIDALMAIEEACAFS
jgi:hypothetical protein